MKFRVIIGLNGNLINDLLIKANADDRDAVFELLELVNIEILFGDKGYVGKLVEGVKQEKNIKLYALKQSNSKNPLPKEFRNLISHLRRRIESTFHQLIEHFDIEHVRSKSILDLQSSLIFGQIYYIF